MDWKVLLSLGLLVCSAAATNTTRCFECSDVPHPAYCQRITQCTEGQKCVVEEIVTSGGLVLFNSGCLSPARCGADAKRIVSGQEQASEQGPVPNEGPNQGHGPALSRQAEDDLTTCVQCCDGDFCNRQGCGTVAKKPPERGPLCFQCDYLNSPDQCRNVAQCRIDEVCTLIEWSPPVANGQTIYRSSCQPPSICAASTLPLLGKRLAASRCHTCTEDFCNDKCPHTTASPSTSTARPPSTAQSTTSNSSPAKSSTQQSPAPTQTKATPTSPATQNTSTPTSSIETTSPTRMTPTTLHPRFTQQFKDRCVTKKYSYDDHSGLCFAYHHENPRTWQDAVENCGHENATLAVVDTDAKWQHLVKFLSHHASLQIQVYRDQTAPEELSDQDRLPAFIGGRYVGDSYQWTNNATFQFAAWGKEQPSHSSSDPCVSVCDEDRLWHNSRCSNKWAYVCTMEPLTPSTVTPTVSTSHTTPTLANTSTLTTTTRQSTTSATPVSTTSGRLRELCERYRYHYDEHSKLCYALHDDHASWDKAKDHCEHEHGTLAMIDTAAKWDVLSRLIQEKYDEDVYIGGRGDGTHSKDYHWTNGARFDFSAWAHGQPDSSHEDCVAVDHDKHLWRDTHCHNNLQFVCTMELHL